MRQEFFYVRHISAFATESRSYQPTQFGFSGAGKLIQVHLTKHRIQTRRLKFSLVWVFFGVVICAWCIYSGPKTCCLDRILPYDSVRLCQCYRWAALNNKVTLDSRYIFLKTKWWFWCNIMDFEHSFRTFENDV